MAVKILASIFLSVSGGNGVRSANSLYMATRNSADNDLEPNMASLVATQARARDPPPTQICLMMGAGRLLSSSRPAKHTEISAIIQTQESSEVPRLSSYQYRTDLKAAQ